MESLLESLQITEHALAVMVGLPRILMIMAVVPFLGSQVLTGHLKMCIAVSFYLVLHPVMLETVSFSGGGIYYLLHVAVVMIKECVLGILIGFLIGVVFWAVQSAGFFIDNQRGLTQAMGSDALSGEESSPLGIFLFQAITYVFFAGGSFVLFLNFLYASYVLWPVQELLPFSVFMQRQFPLFFVEQVNGLMLMMLLLSAPIVVTCLLTDISLGLINRFAAQLNVYILAMPIKSGLVSFLLIFYFSILIYSVLPHLNSVFYEIQFNMDRLL